MEATLRDWLGVHAPEELREAMVAACCARGKRKGRVLASVPTAKGPRVVGVWRALMSELAVTRAGSFALMWADDEEREAFREADEWLNSNPGGIRLGLIVALAGGAPFEFHLRHMNIDPKSLRDVAHFVGIDPKAMGAD